MKVWKTSFFIIGLAIIIAVSLNIKSYANQIDSENPQFLDAIIAYDYTEFNFGDVPPGESVSHSFPVKNTGKDTLTISKIKAGCGCTTLKADGLVIAPGGVQYIDVTYKAPKTDRYIGKQRKRIRIHSNDTVDPVTDIYVKAYVNTPKLTLKISPILARFENASIYEIKNTSVEISNQSSESISLKIINKPDQNFITKCALKQPILKPNESTSLEISLQSSTAIDNFITSVTIEMNDDEEQRISIPIYGMVIDREISAQ